MDLLSLFPTFGSTNVRKHFFFFKEKEKKEEIISEKTTADPHVTIAR